MRFQSTLPVWGETLSARIFSINSVISIHSPRVGRDEQVVTMLYRYHKFQSTLPVWGETCFRNNP